MLNFGKNQARGRLEIRGQRHSTHNTSILYNSCVSACHVRYFCRPACEIMHAMVVASTHTLFIVYLSTDRLGMCTMFYVLVVLLLLLSLFLCLSLCVCLCSRVPHTTISKLHSTNVCRNWAFIPYFPSGTYYFSICDHGPDSLHTPLYATKQ